MVDALKKGMKTWNWGGTWASQSGVYNFKKNGLRTIFAIPILEWMNKRMLSYKKEEIAKRVSQFYGAIHSAVIGSMENELMKELVIVGTELLVKLLSNILKNILLSDVYHSLEQRFINSTSSRGQS